MLDVHNLRALRQRRGGREALSEQYQDRRLCLTRAAIKRTESGIPVPYRTACHLAAFYGIGVETLIEAAPRRRTPPAPAPAPAEPLDVERLQCRAVVDAVHVHGQGRLIDVQGVAGSGKSRLLDFGVRDARARGYTCVVLDGGPATTTAGHTATRLMLALLGVHQDAGSEAHAGFDAHAGADAHADAHAGADAHADAHADAGAGIDADAAALAARVRARCVGLGLPAVHVDACVTLVDAAPDWPLPADQLMQTAALCALIQLRARHRPLLICIDDLQSADWQLAMILNVAVPATLDYPVLWMFATRLEPGPTRRPLGVRMDALARTTLHLTPPDARAGRADAGGVHRLARTSA
jgi:hypothetical protein